MSLFLQGKREERCCRWSFRLADFRGIVSLLLTRTPTSFHHTTLLPFITTLLPFITQPYSPSSQPYSPLLHNSTPPFITVSNKQTTQVLTNQSANNNLLQSVSSKIGSLFLRLLSNNRHSIAVIASFSPTASFRCFKQSRSSSVSEASNSFCNSFPINSITAFFRCASVLLGQLAFTALLWNELLVVREDVSQTGGCAFPKFHIEIIDRGKTTTCKIVRGIIDD